MNLLLMQNNGLPKNGLVAMYDPGKQVALGAQGQSLIDFSGKGNNAQLGSTAGADTNDPAWSGNGLVFGADDYCITSLPITTAATIIAVCKSAVVPSGTQVVLGQTGNDGWFGVNATQVLQSQRYGGAGSTTYGVNITPNAYNCFGTMVGTNLRNIFVGGSKNIDASVSSAGIIKPITFDRLCALGGSFIYNGTIAFFALYNRVLSDAEYLRAYNLIKRLMATRGITL